ncbi:Modulator of FtsH protease HflK [bacterium HR11]|nr:Modulator of FtsH protease HflK [bacterium HR11]
MVVAYIYILFFALAFLLILIRSAVFILREYERGVVFRLGRLLPHVRGPGLVLIIPFVDRLIRVDLRVQVHDVPPQDIITRDNVSVKVNAVVYYRVFDPKNAIVQVENYQYATSQLAQTTLRSVLGEVELDELLSQREKLNLKLQQILDRHTDPWGVKVTLVELKHVDLPQTMQRAMARQAEAERERRAKVIHAEGELQASRMLQEAASIMAQQPMTLQLRYLQTLTEIASERNSTVVFPIPLDLITPFIPAAWRAAANPSPRGDAHEGLPPGPAGS